MKFELIMPIAAQHYDTAKVSITYLKKFSPQKILIISSLSVKEKVINDFGDDAKISFINEDEMVEGLSLYVVKKHLSKHHAEKRGEWYFQQFLKMGYAFVCECDYYLSWDADTIPVGKVDLFQNNTPVFATKNVFHQDMFDTIYSLLGLSKQIERSYIAEYMMFNKNIMIELINIIAQKSSSPWFLNIMDCIEPKALPYSGFSEFETYGTYVQYKYPGHYSYRDVSALRNGRRFFSRIPSDDVLDWLGNYYSTISFEKWDENRLKGRFAEYKFVRKLVPANFYIKLCNKYIAVLDKCRKYILR